MYCLVLLISVNSVTGPEKKAIDLAYTMCNCAVTPI